MKRAAVGTLVRLALVAAIGVLLWFFIRKIQWDALADALYSARLWPLVPAMALSFVMIWCHATGFGRMLAPRYAVPITRLFRYTIVAYAASVLAPARAGELARVWLLKQRHGVPTADTAAAAVGQKLVDGVTMLLFVSPIPLLLPDVPGWIGRAILIGAGIAVAVFAALYIAVGRMEGREARNWLTRFISGLHVLRSPRRVLSVLVAQLGAWCADLLMVSLVLYAVGIDLPIAAGLLILFTLNLTIMVPTPANIGSLELGVFAATRLLGVPDERALAFALLYHAGQVVPILIAGLSLELKLLLGREPETA